MDDLDRLQTIRDLVHNVTTLAPDQFADPKQAEADFWEYDRLRGLQAHELIGGQEQRRTELRQRVVAMMSLDEINADKLDYGKEKVEADNQKFALETDAERSGIDKISNDFTGRKKSAAKKKLAKDDAYRKKIKAKNLQTEADERLVEGERQYKVSEGYDDQLEEGLNSYKFLQRISNRMVMGPHKSRRAEMPESRKSELDFGENIFSEPINIQTKDGLLKGVMHRPMENPTGKMVIFYSGSGLRNAAQSPAPTKMHLKNGASVLCVDYRGFGDSISTDKQGERVGTQMVEDGMYRDSLAIYEYASTLVSNPSDIILHGYSLGGSMASRVAADVSIRNAHLQKDNKITENMRLGGLILQSPISSTRSAGRLLGSESPEAFQKDKVSLLGKFEGWVGNHSSGKFSTEDHLQVIAKYDPYIPTVFMSGRSVADVKVNEQTGKEMPGDFLSLKDTRVDQQPGLLNRTTFIGQGTHAVHMDMHNGTKSAEEQLKQLVKLGRSTDMQSDEARKLKDIEIVDNYKHPPKLKQAYIKKFAEDRGNVLTEAMVYPKFIQYCQDNTSDTINVGVSNLQIPNDATPEQAKKALVESKPYVLCVGLMTHIGKSMLEPDQLNVNPITTGDATLIADLQQPMQKGNLEANRQNVAVLQGKLEEQSFRFFMQNEKVQALYNQMQERMSTTPFFTAHPDIMAQALGLLFTDLTLAYSCQIAVKDNSKVTPLHAIAQGKSLMKANVRKTFTEQGLDGYMDKKDIENTRTAVTDGIAGLIERQLQNKKEEK